jgi:CBS domain-containing protein
MLDQPVRSVMQRRKVLKVSSSACVSEVAVLMASKNVGAVMVIENQRLVGIFTERDAVFRVMARGLDARTTRLADVMTSAPQTIEPDKPFGYALTIMYENGFRHLPVIENGKPIGIVSARSAMDPDLEDFVAEARRRVHYRKER